jgi:toxin FitB
MRYLLDTNVVSELVARQPSPRVIQWIDSLDPDSIYLSVITIGELRKGIEKLAVSQRKDMLYTWLNDDLLIRFSGRILILDIPVMLAWGELVGRLEQQGRPLPSLDSLIAAQAQVHNCTLATRNHGDFQATGVNIVNPWN